MEQRNAEPVDRKRFQVRGAAITKLFQAPIAPHLGPWQVHVHLFAMNQMSVHVISFAIQQFSLQKLQPNPLVQKTIFFCRRPLPFGGSPPHLRPLLKDKKLLLWKEILLDL